MKSSIEMVNASNARSLILAVQSVLTLLKTHMMNLPLTSLTNVLNVKQTYKYFLKTKRPRSLISTNTLLTGPMNGTNKAVDTLIAE